MNLILIIFIFLMCVYLGEKLTLKSFDNIKINRNCSGYRVFKKEEIKLTMTIENESFIPIPFIKIREQLPIGIELNNTNKNVEFGDDLKFSYINTYLKLKGRERITRNYKFTCDNRGVYYIQNIDISLGDFLGLIKKEFRLEKFSEIVVYPNIISSNKLNLVFNSLFGKNTIKRWIFEDPLYVKGVREYRINDRFKDIHWNASAKMNRLMTKDYDFTGDKKVKFILNTQLSKNDLYSSNKTLVDKAAIIIASLSKLIISEKMSVGAAVNSNIISYYNKAISECPQTKNINTILEFCSRIGTDLNSSFDDFIKNMSKQTNNVDIYIIITMYIDDVIKESINEMKNRGVIIKIIDMSQNGDIQIKGIQKIHPLWEKIV